MTIIEDPKTTPDVFVQDTRFLKELDLRVDLGKYKSLLTVDEALEIGDTIFLMFPHMRHALETAITDIQSDDIHFVRSGLSVLRDAIVVYNDNVRCLIIQEERMLSQDRMGLLSKDDPRRPAWLDA